jgi:hypothetical protein
MYSGSLVGSGFHVYAVWNYIIAKTKCGIVELNPKLLAAVLGGPVKDVEAAIAFLIKPDPDSRSKEEEGRRLVKEGQYQYRVVNWAFYQGIKNAEDLREYNRIRQAEYRKSRKQTLGAAGKQLPGETIVKRAIARGESQGYIDKLSDPDFLKESSSPPFTAEKSYGPEVW